MTVLVAGGEYAGGASTGGGRLVGCVTAKGVEFDGRRGRPAGLLSMVGDLLNTEDVDDDAFLELNRLKGFNVMLFAGRGDAGEQKELL